MFLKTINITLGILVALSVAGVAVLLAVAALHVAVIGGLTVYHLMYS